MRFVACASSRAVFLNPQPVPIKRKIMNAHLPGNLKPKWIALHSIATAAVATVLASASPAFALNGQIGIHDPSTVTFCDGKYYTFGTGGGGLISDDGWTWRGGAVRPGGGVAPDVIHLGDRYLVSYAGTGVHTMWTKSLDTNSPDFGYHDDTVVATGDLECNAIDPAFLLDPTDGKLWLTYGSYVGYIRLIELDPKTGKPVDTNRPPVNIAVNCEAPCMIYHDGWYYLLATHGSCCQGANSGYNIRVGRGQKIAGPFRDNMGVDMLQGGGKLVIDSSGRVVGAGHFGLLDLGENGAQKFSMHWEADLDRGGASVLDIRPLLWKDGWPVAGENMKEGTYEIESVRTGTALELAVEGVPVGGARARGAPGGGFGGRGGPGDTNAVAGRGGFSDTGGTNAGAGRGARGGAGGFGAGGGGRGIFGGSGAPVPPQDVAQVSTNWPAGDIDVRMANYLLEAQQKWTLTAVTNVGYPGSPYFKITIAGTDRALTATADGELIALPAFAGAPEQLWRLDQLIDGTWRIMPKAVPNSKEKLAISAVGSSSATLAKFNPDSDRQRWLFKTP
jgi:arabinan endo-1,5-alpha-L-arabinosidase